MQSLGSNFGASHNCQCQNCGVDGLFFFALSPESGHWRPEETRPSTVSFSTRHSSGVQLPKTRVVSRVTWPTSVPLHPVLTAFLVRIPSMIISVTFTLFLLWCFNFSSTVTHLSGCWDYISEHNCGQTLWCFSAVCVWFFVTYFFSHRGSHKCVWW